MVVGPSHSKWEILGFKYFCHTSVFVLNDFHLGKSFEEMNMFPKVTMNRGP
jgi:hypothetical protein